MPPPACNPTNSAVSVGRGTIALGAVLVVGGGAALGYALTRTPDTTDAPARNAKVDDAIQKLDLELKTIRTTVEGRAKKIAIVTPVRSAITTDVPTAQNMVGEAGKELDFSPDSTEVIELVQIPTGQRPLSLLIMPPDAVKTTRQGKVGPYDELAGDQIILTHTVEIIPYYPDKVEAFKGYVTTSRRLDLKPAIATLSAAGVVGRFELAGKTLEIGVVPTGTALEDKPLMSIAGAKLAIVAPKPEQPSDGLPIPLVGIGAGVAGLGLLLVLIGLMTGKKRGADAAADAVAVRSLAGQTQLSGQHAVASGTPSSVDSSGPAINPHNLGAGAMIGRWEVVRRLGSGGMADVYLAHSKGEAGFEKLVAIKVMHSHLARNERAVEHFLDEARLAARIHHPNVVAIQDLGKIGNEYVIVMDYVEGVDLERLLTSSRTANRPIPVDVGLGILCRICDGLNAAHTAVGPDGTPLGIIHRDVKSANVLVSRQGGVKVVDFGIAKAASQAHLTVAGETKGTPSMMAPEQRVGERVDVRADVYAVAAVGFEILAGHAVNLDLAALAHLGVDNWPHLPLPSSLRPQLPAELDQILLGAMAFEREKRPADCVAFEAEFAKVMKQHGFATTDKDIARWVEGELRLLEPAYEGGSIIPRPAGSMPT